MSKSPPKIVQIKLSSPQRQKKTTSASKQPFHAPLSKLKKTFNEGTNVYDHIRDDHERRKSQLMASKKHIEKLQKQRLKDQQPLTEITHAQMQICMSIFRQLDKQNKSYTIKDDLKNIKQNVRLQEIVKVVYNRKEINSFYDFMYALWDSQRLAQLVNENI